MDEGCGAVIAGLVVIAFIIWLIIVVLSALYSALVALCYATFVGLDWVTGAAAFPSLPWAAWAAFGFLAGGAFALSHEAHVYGVRAKRPLELFAIALLLLVALGLLVSYLGRT